MVSAMPYLPLPSVYFGSMAYHNLPSFLLIFFLLLATIFTFFSPSPPNFFSPFCTDGIFWIFFCSSHFIGFLELANLRWVGLVLPVFCLVLKKKNGLLFLFLFFPLIDTLLSSSLGKRSTKRKKGVRELGAKG